MAFLNIDEGIFYLLSHDTEVKLIVVKRIYPLMLPQNPTLPAITYQLISPMNLIAHNGAVGTAYCRYQINAFDDDFDGVKLLVDKIRLCMDGYKGAIGTTSTINVQAMLPDGGGDDYDPETKRFRSFRDYVIWHDEQVT